MRRFKNINFILRVCPTTGPKAAWNDEAAMKYLPYLTKDLSSINVTFN